MMHLDAEIDSLKARRSNIPAEQIAMRAALCKALSVPETEMPFAGELLQVHEDERDWEGAAERLLRNFGLSLLVPDEYYATVADGLIKHNSEDAWSISGYARMRAVSLPRCTGIRWRAN
jgi:uncharacterized protein YPO0396